MVRRSSCITSFTCSAMAGEREKVMVLVFLGDVGTLSPFLPVNSMKLSYYTSRHTQASTTRLLRRRPAGSSPPTPLQPPSERSMTEECLSGAATTSALAIFPFHRTGRVIRACLPHPANRHPPLRMDRYAKDGGGGMPLRVRRLSYHPW